MPPPRPPVAVGQTSWTPRAPAGSCGAFHLTVAFRDGQVRPPPELSRRHLRRDRAQPRRWVPGNNDAQLNSASRHTPRHAPANAVALCRVVSCRVVSCVARVVFAETVGRLRKREHRCPVHTVGGETSHRVCHI